MSKDSLSTTMVLRIRLITSTDDGGLYVRDVPIVDRWRRAPGDPLAAFHRHVCDVLTTEGVSMHQLDKCTALTMWYVSGPDNTVYDLFDPHAVPDNSLVCFDSLSSSLMRTYTNPKCIHVYDMSPIEQKRVLMTHSQSNLSIVLDGGVELSMPFPTEHHSGMIFMWTLEHIKLAGICVHDPRAYVINEAWSGELLPYTGRHQLQGGNKLRICGKVDLPAAPCAPLATIG